MVVLREKSQFERSWRCSKLGSRQVEQSATGGVEDRGRPGLSGRASSSSSQLAMLIVVHLKEGIIR